MFVPCRFRPAALSAVLALVPLIGLSLPATAAQSEATVATSSAKCATFLIGDDQNRYILARTVGAGPAPAEDSPLRGDFSHPGIIKVEIGPKGKGKLQTIEVLKVGKSSADTVPAYLNACGE